VFTEYLTFFATAPEPFRRAAAEGVERILAEFRHSRDCPEPGLFSHGPAALPVARPDKGYSLTDCISMQTMPARRDHGSTDK